MSWLSLAKGFLTSLSKDKDGLKELITRLYDTYYPIIAAYYAGVPGMEEDALTSAEKEKEIALVADQLISAVNEILPDFDKNVNELFEGTPELRTVLGKDTVLSLDFLLDSKMNIRKQNMDLTVQLLSEQGHSGEAGEGAFRSGNVENQRACDHPSGGRLQRLLERSSGRRNAGRGAAPSGQQVGTVSFIEERYADHA